MGTRTAIFQEQEDGSYTAFREQEIRAHSYQTRGRFGNVARIYSILERT